MKKIFFILLLTTYYFLLPTPCLYAELGIGLGWPYLGLKYNFSKRVGSELRWATGEGINVYAGRFYWNFCSSDKLKLFDGIEGGYITFDTLDIKGTGYEGAVFLGGEYFLTKRFSLSMDISPTFSSLESDNFSVTGIGWVTNLSLYYYFTTTDQKEKQVVEPVKIDKPVELTNLAVADFAVKNVSAADASIIASFLRTEIVQLGVCNVIEKANMDKILAEAAFQATGCTTSECAVQIGKILNVQQMIVGDLSKLMDTYYITVNLVDVETGKILKSEKIEAYTSKQLSDACKIIAKKITQ